jgi:hypothetical protein
MDFSSCRFLQQTVSSTKFGGHEVLAHGDFQPKEFKFQPTLNCVGKNPLAFD